MTYDKTPDLAEWYQRLYVASEELRIAVEEISALVSSRGVDLNASWCRHLVRAAVHGLECFQELEAVFEAEEESDLAGSEPPSALYVKSH